MCAEQITPPLGDAPVGDASDACPPATQAALQSLLDGIGDMAFAIDGSGLILGWNRAAARFVGRGQNLAREYACSEAYHCRSLDGEALCAAACPLLQAIRTHQPAISQTIHIIHESGINLEAREIAIPLPAGLGDGALIIISPNARGVVAAGPASSGDVEHPAPTAHSDGLSLHLDALLDRLLIATGADAAEVFLATATAGPLLLAAYRGQAPRAFHQRIAFDLGEGFPGLVVQTAQPLRSTDLAHDERYLRTDVKRHGFRSYLCVPIWSRQAIVGSLQIASRHQSGIVGNSSLDQLQPFLTEVAAELGTTLELARREAGASIERELSAFRAAPDSTLQQFVQQAIQGLGELAQVDGGALLVTDEHSDRLLPLGIIGLSPRARGIIAHRCRCTICPALSAQRWVLPGRESGEDRAPCPLHRGELAPALCVPLVANGAPLGVAVLRGRQRASLPRERIPLLLAPVARIAEALAQARVPQHPEVSRPAGISVRPLPAGSGVTPIRPTDQDRDLVSPSAPSRPILDLRCFGAFALYRNGYPVLPQQFARRRSLVILKILLTRYGKSVHRDELQEILWPDVDSAAARPLLNVAIHYLRRGLEPDLPEGATSRYIQTMGDAYAFATDGPHRLDTEVFRVALETAAQAEEHGEIHRAIAAREEALATYAGDFLEDEIYSDWCALERTYLRERFLSALRQLARNYVQVQCLDEAIACLRRALRAEATLEDVHRFLMKALWQAGRRDEAVRQYQECRLALHQSLGINPDPTTEQLYRQIARSDYSPRSPLSAG